MTDPFFDFFGEAKATLPKADAFKLLDAAIPKRSSLPCIQRVKITGEPGYLTFEGTDLDFAVSVRTGNFLDLEGSTDEPLVLGRNHKLVVELLWWVKCAFSESFQVQFHDLL